MTTKQALYLGVAAIAIAAVWAGSVVKLGAQQAAERSGAHRQRRHRRRGHRAERARGRRLGDRRDDRPSHQVRQDRGHRRPGPLRGARPAEGQVQGLGARLRPRRFAEGRRRARQAAESPRGAGAERGGGGAVLSGDLLVLDAQDPGRRPVRRQEQHSREHHPERLAHRGEEPGLHRLPPARPALHAHDPGGARRVRAHRKRRGSAACSRDRPAHVHAEPAHRAARRRAVQVLRRLDRPHRQGRAAAQRRRRGRRASSATSSSRRGTGATRRSTCTT